MVAEFEQAAGCQFEVPQVKEKFGGLRIHVTYANDATRQRIEAAKEESFGTCEVCGQTGTLREGDWNIGSRLCARNPPVQAARDDG